MEDLKNFELSDDWKNLDKFELSDDWKELFKDIHKPDPEMELATKRMKEGLAKIAKALEDGKLRPFIIHPEIF